MPDTFYETLPEVADFEALASPDSYRPLPDGWWVVAADVPRSTRAITEGRYKAVTLAASSEFSGLSSLPCPAFPLPSPAGFCGLCASWGSR